MDKRGGAPESRAVEKMRIDEIISAAKLDVPGMVPDIIFSDAIRRRFASMPALLYSLRRHRHLFYWLEKGLENLKRFCLGIPKVVHRLWRNHHAYLPQLVSVVRVELGLNFDLRFAISAFDFRFRVVLNDFRRLGVDFAVGLALGAKRRVFSQWHLIHRRLVPYLNFQTA